MFILLISFIIIAPTWANDLHPYWLGQSSTPPPEELVLSRFERKVRENLEQQEHSLALITERKGWGVKAVNTSLAVTTSGSLGSLAWGGTKAIELFWAKKSSTTQPLDSESIKLNSITSPHQLAQQMSALTNRIGEHYQLSELKRHQLELKLSEQVGSFLDFSHSLALERGHHSFELDKVRLDLIVDLSASASGFFVKAGGDLRLRFEWKNKPLERITPLRGINPHIMDFQRKVLNALDDSNIEKIVRSGFDLSYIRVGAVVSASGNVGILKLKGAVGYHVFYRTSKKHPHTLTPHPEEELALVESAKQSFNLSTRKVSKGLKKAIKFAGKIANSIHKRREQGKWGINKFRTSYTFNVGGELGVASLKAGPSLELEFKNQNF